MKKWLKGLIVIPVLLLLLVLIVPAAASTAIMVVLGGGEEEEGKAGGEGVYISLLLSAEVESYRQQGRDDLMISSICCPI